jgi:hypothetical protein
MTVVNKVGLWQSETCWPAHHFSGTVVRRIGTPIQHDLCPLVYPVFGLCALCCYMQTFGDHHVPRFQTRLGQEMVPNQQLSRRCYLYRLQELGTLCIVTEIDPY